MVSTVTGFQFVALEENCPVCEDEVSAMQAVCVVGLSTPTVIAAEGTPTPMV